MKKYLLDGEIASFDFKDESGFWSFCGPKSLKAFLADLKPGEKAEIEINSPGGSVVYGAEMANAIKNSSAHIIAHVTGMAVSMASVIACACDEIVMEEASFMMIHDPWTYVEGNAENLRKSANLLDQMKELCLSFYRGKFNRSEEELAKLMSAETYMTANECVEAGLKCRVVQSDLKFAAKLTQRDMAKAPDGVKAFFKSAEMPEAVRAAVEAARQAAEAAAPTAEATEPTAESAASTVVDDAPVVDWEARYKGASKKINELQARIADLEKREAERATETVDYGAVVAERDALKAQSAQLEETATKAADALKKISDQLESSEKALAAAQAKVSELGGKLETSEKALVQANQQLDHFKSTRDLLTGGVLTPSEGGSDYQAKMAEAKSPEEREKLRAQQRKELKKKTK